MRRQSGEPSKESNGRLIESLAIPVTYLTFVQRAKNWILGISVTKKIVPIGNK
jgi:hypothetical protein